MVVKYSIWLEIYFGFVGAAGGGNRFWLTRRHNTAESDMLLFVR